MRVKEYFSLVKNSFTEFSNDRVPRMGAALAYYIVFSIAPVLIISISIAGLIFGEEAARGEIFGQIESTVGPGAAQSIQDMLANVSTPSGNIIMMIVGAVTLLIGASGVFAELQDSLNTIFRAPPQQGTGIWNAIRRRFLSFAMVLAIGFLLLVALVLSAVLSAVTKFVAPDALPGTVYLWQAITLLVSFGFVTLLFALIYKVLPDDELRWRDVFMGALVSAFLFTVGKFLLGLYLGQTSTVSSYGAAGSLVVLLIWVYYSAQILLFGAEFSRLYALRSNPAQQARERPAAAESAASDTTAQRIDWDGKKRSEREPAARKNGRKD